MNGSRAVLRHHGSADSGNVLLALPPAGIGASSYAGLARCLTDCHVWALQPPGRENRLSDPHPGSLQELATALLDAVIDDLPPSVALYGHSLGAIVAYEVALQLERRGRAPRFLMVGGARSPERFSAASGFGVDLSDEALLGYSTALGGRWSEFTDPEFAQLMLGVLRRDLRLGFGYQLHDVAKLACPVVACAGAADPAVDGAALDHWAAVTRSSYEAHVIPGGHMFFTESPGDLGALISETWRLTADA